MCIFIYVLNKTLSSTGFGLSRYWSKIAILAKNIFPQFCSSSSVSGSFFVAEHDALIRFFEKCKRKAGDGVKVDNFTKIAMAREIMINPECIGEIG